jgi:hypothetical protein
MSAPFVSQLRTNQPALELVKPGAGTLTLRVEASDVWDTVRAVVSPDTPVSELKQRAVALFFPNEDVSPFMLKLRGWEILDENASVRDAGLVDGSIVLLAYRRRRPVR